jgi:integrase
MTCLAPAPLPILPPSALPIDRGDMRQQTLPDGRIRLVYDYRGPSGPNHVKATLPAGTRIADIIKAKAELVAKAERRSLKSQGSLFENMVEVVVKQNQGAGMIWVYRRIARELAGPMDASFTARYNRYMDKLQYENKSCNTVANHKGAIQRVLKTAWKRHEIDNIPVRDFAIRRKFRDRVLSQEERRRLENVMLEQRSHLYWSVRLAERRPIRGLSDLWHLTRENLILFGEGAPYIRLSAVKTDLETHVPLRDLPDVLEYLMRALPSDCPYLFPRLEGDIASVTDFDGMRRANWHRTGDPRHHFDTLKKLADIKDFHFHDFKRMATTHMLDVGGYTAEDLLDLGFYATRDMIDRCYKKRDAVRVLRRLSVGPAVGPEVQNAAI